MTSSANASGPKSPVESGRGFSLRLSIATVVVFSMLLVAVVVIGTGWVGARANAIDTATRVATDAGRSIGERAKGLLEPAKSSLRQLTFDPITTARTLEARLARIYVMSEELVANPLLSSVYVGYEDGEFLLVRPLDQPAQRKLFAAPPKSNFMAQSRTRDRQGRWLGEYLFFDTDRRLLERRAMPDYRFDPRTRPWYQDAQATGQPSLSEPYAYFTTRELGVTLSQLSHSGESVVGIDVVLDELSRSLADLRVTRHARIALVNARQEVLADPDQPQTVQLIQGAPRFRRIQDLNDAGLSALADLATGPSAQSSLGQARMLQIQGQEVLGLMLPFEMWSDQGMRLLVTAPVDELLGDLSVKRRRMVMLVAALVLGMLALSWPLAARIGHGIEGLTDKARAVARFHFTRADMRPSAIKEVNELALAMQGMSQTIESFLELSHRMATEPDVERMLEQVLQLLVQATRSHAGAVYLWDEGADCMQVAAVHGPSETAFEPRLAGPGTAAPSPAGEQRSELLLQGRQGNRQGLLVLLHQGDDGHQDLGFQQFAQQLSGMLAVSIETRQLIDAQKKLLDGVIRLMADAIDAKSPYTGGHCERVPELAVEMMEELQSDANGPYAGFRLNEQERYAFQLGAWLHDCGKVTSPEHIVDKATKLELISNRIHEVRLRFELLWRDAEIACWQALAQGQAPDVARAALAERQRALQDDFAFVAACNLGSETLSDEAIARLHALGAQTWQRHFDDRLGLSTEELDRLQTARPQAPSMPASEPLLADRPEHRVPWGPRRPPVEKGDPGNVYGFDMPLPLHKQNMGELHNLSVRRGTLTEEDRFRINEHIVQTYTMLKSLPWPQALSRVPELAATHHERLDGQGYPRRLKADQLGLPERVMALADVFEALTAADRPYKTPKPLSETLAIMARMCREQHLDAELFRYFLHRALWQRLARRHLHPAQIDHIDTASIEALLPVHS
ncbi:MAG: metal-dependent phosphohydrolase [Curvibacter sp.]|nr:MAG: metal-dependent phosphohydrolase [Curvibacter sp.]